MSTIQSLDQSQGSIGILAYLFISFIPLIIPICLIIISSFNKDLKGFMFLVGLMAGIIILRLIPSSSTITNNDTWGCSLYFLNAASKLPLNAYIISFTITYFILCMFFVQKWNELLISFLLIVLVADSIIYTQKFRCKSISQYTLTVLIGCIISASYVTMLNNSSAKNDLLYNYDIISNKEMCTRNFGNKKRFVCSKRKNVTKAPYMVS